MVNVAHLFLYSLLFYLFTCQQFSSSHGTCNHFQLWNTIINCIFHWLCQWMFFKRVFGFVLQQEWYCVACERQPSVWNINSNTMRLHFMMTNKGSEKRMTIFQMLPRLHHTSVYLCRHFLNKRYHFFTHISSTSSTINVGFHMKPATKREQQCMNMTTHNCTVKWSWTHVCANRVGAYGIYEHCHTNFPMKNVNRSTDWCSKYRSVFVKW